jgi:sugar fermentation stimulation protein A
LYKFPSLIEARLIKRYKRFLVDVQLDDSSELTAHCANTGAMTGCKPDNARVWLSESDNPKRKYPHSWQLVELDNKYLACINTSLTNPVAKMGIEQGDIPELAGYKKITPEVVYGKESSRIDFLLEGAPGSHVDKCYVEVKHVTLKLESGLGAFPDSVSIRGQKHLRELQNQVEKGDRAVLLFLIMRPDIDQISPADSIDPLYGQLLRQAINNGVEVLAYKTDISLQGIKLAHSIPIII